MSSPTLTEVNLYGELASYPLSLPGSNGLRVSLPVWIVAAPGPLSLRSADVGLLGSRDLTSVRLSTLEWLDPETDATFKRCKWQKDRYVFVSRADGRFGPDPERLRLLMAENLEAQVSHLAKV